MVDIQSKEIIDKMSEDLKVQPAMALPRTLVNNIQPVFSVNSERAVSLTGNIQRTTSANGAGILVLPTGKRFFLTSLMIQNVSDATADNTSIRITGISADTGASMSLAGMSKITLTAFSDSISREFNTPIEIQAGSTISLTNIFTLGVSVTHVSVEGYLVDPL